MLILLWNAPSTGTPPEPPIVQQGAGYQVRFPKRRRPVEDDDDIMLLVWFTYMQRYYE
jgi:hypothetical protein